MNCWEVIKCKKKVRKHCPAFPDKGLDCWKITGTKCQGGQVEMKTLREKIIYCKSCEFFEKYVTTFFYYKHHKLI